MHQKWECQRKKCFFVGLFNLFNRNSAALNPATCENKVSKKSQEIMSASTKKRACVKYPSSVGIYKNGRSSFFYGASKLIHAGFLAVTSHGGAMAVSIRSKMLDLAETQHLHHFLDGAIDGIETL